MQRASEFLSLLLGYTESVNEGRVGVQVYYQQRAISPVKRAGFGLPSFVHETVDGIFLVSRQKQTKNKSSRQFLRWLKWREIIFYFSVNEISRVIRKLKVSAVSSFRQKCSVTNFCCVTPRMKHTFFLELTHGVASCESELKFRNWRLPDLHCLELLGIVCRCLLFPGIASRCLALFGVAWRCLMLPGVTNWCCLRSLWDAWCGLVLTGATWHCLASLGITWRRSALLGVAWPRLASPGLIWHCLASLGIAWHC